MKKASDYDKNYQTFIKKMNKAFPRYFLRHQLLLDSRSKTVREIAELLPSTTNTLTMDIDYCKLVNDIKTILGDYETTRDN